MFGIYVLNYGNYAFAFLPTPKNFKAPFYSTLKEEWNKLNPGLLIILKKTVTRNK
jgi:hypothetical protein